MSVVQTVKLCLSLSPLERHTKFRPKFGPLFPSPSSLPFTSLSFPATDLRNARACDSEDASTVASVSSSLSNFLSRCIHSIHFHFFCIPPTHRVSLAVKQSSASGTQFGALMRPISSPLLVLLLFWSRVLHLLLLLLSLAPSFPLPYRSSSL